MSLSRHRPDDHDTFYAYYEDCDDDSLEEDKTYSDWVAINLTGHSPGWGEPDVKLATQDEYPPYWHGYWYNSSSSGNEETVLYGMGDDEDQVVFTVRVETLTDEPVAYEVTFATDCQQPQAASTSFTESYTMTR